MPVSLEVTFAAYLAVLLGTFVPVTFLIVLYAQVTFLSCILHQWLSSHPASCFDFYLLSLLMAHCCSSLQSEARKNS